MQHFADSTTASPTHTGRPRDTVSTRLIIRADRWIYRFSRRWLAAFNLVSVAVLGLILAAPVLAAVGRAGIAKPIYTAFGLFCHQDPERSFHIAGHQVACCERCAAIYSSIVLFGLLFAFVRTSIRKPTYTELVLLISPVTIDGMAVGAGVYGGNILIRVVTGTLFGLAMIWLLYPRFEDGFASMRARIETMFGRLVEQGRAEPLR